MPLYRGATLDARLGSMESGRDALTATVGGAALGEGIWSWFSNPRAICHEDTRRQLYTGSVRSNGDVVAQSYDLDTREFVEFVLSAAFEADDHDNPVFVVRPDGRIIAFWSKHGTDWKIHYRISTSPESILAWGAEQTLDLGSNTYVNPHYLGSSLYLFSRGFIREAGSMVPGDPAPASYGAARSPHMWVSADDGGTWGAPVEMFRSIEVAVGQVPYLQYASNGSRIDFLASSGHPNSMSAGSCHMYHWYMAGGNLYRSDGTLIRSVASLTATGPLTVNDVTRFYTANTDKGVAVNGNAWPWSIEYDGTGKPVVTFSIFSAQDDNHYVRARWTGAAWERKVLLTGQPAIRGIGNTGQPQYVGGLHLDPANTDRIYLSLYTADQWEIQRWDTANGGDTWTATAITRLSSAKNFRPYVPRNRLANSPEVVWPRGWYQNYSVDEYDTDLLAYPALDVAKPLGRWSHDIGISRSSAITPAGSGDLLLLHNNFVAPAAANSAFGAFPFDPADYPDASGLRVRFGVLVGAIAPARDIVCHLWPVDAVGSSSTVTVTAGASLGSVTFPAPAIGAELQDEFSVPLPPAGAYLVGINIAGTVATGSLVQVIARVAVADA